jgi:acyl-CoA oxidase
VSAIDTSLPAPPSGGDVSPDRVRAVLDGRWGWIRDLVREELSDPRLAVRIGLEREEHRARVLDQLRHLGTTAGPRLLFPEAYGGGGDLGGAITSFETLAMGDLSLLVKAGVQFGLFGGAILNLGDEEQRATYLPDVMSVDLPGCFAMTETGHGSDVQEIRTTATFDPATDELIVDTPDDDARKDYIGNAARDGRLAVVFCQLIVPDGPQGVHAVLVPIRDAAGRARPGVTITDNGPKAGLNGVDNGRLAFAGVRVPRANLLDRFGQVAADGSYSSPIANEGRRFFTTLGTLVQGRVSVSGAALSATKVALTIATRYAEVRRQFRAPDGDREVVLLDFRQHQRRLLPAIATTYALHATQEQLVVDLHESVVEQQRHPDDLPDERELEAAAAGIKTATTWHATRTIQMAREACGGAGYLAENRLPDLKADTDVFTTFEGDNTVLLQLVAKGLLTDFRDEFGSLDTLGTVRFIADQVVETVVEKTAARRLLRSLQAVVPGRDEDADLHSRAWQRSLFAWREEHVISGVAQRLQRAIKGGADPFEAFNDCQDHVLLAAQAHIDRVVLDRFAAQVATCEDGEVAALLDALCDLHALHTIEANRGWYLEHGRLSSARTKAITAAINALCSRLRPHAGTLVEAWGVPDACVVAPIALGAEAARQDAKAGEAPFG